MSMSNQQTAKVKRWISKYALTKGVYEAEGKIIEDSIANGCFVIEHLYSRDYFSLKEHHETKEAALAKAESMRLKKIESLKKQIAKLEAMTFKEAEHENP